MGREGPGKHQGPIVRPTVGTETSQVLELSGVVRVMEDGVMKKRPGQGGWTGGFHGKRRNGSCRGCQIDNLFPFFLGVIQVSFAVSVQGDSYPEFGAQFTVEGGGSHMSWSATGSFCPFLGTSYIPHGDEIF
jgi:hypothetical protein